LNGRVERPAATKRNASAKSGRGDADGAGLGERRADGGRDFGAGEAFFDAGEDGGIGGRSSVVIAEEGVQRIGGWPDDGDGPDRGFQGECVAIVFEQDDGFASGIESEFAIRGSVHIGESDFGPRNACGRIENAEAEARFKETADGAIDVCRGDQAIFEGAVQDFILRAAGEIGASFEGESGSLIERHDEAVALVEVVDGPAVGDNVAAEAPLIAKKIVEKTIGASGFAANGIVGAHDGVGVAVDDGGAEGGRVGVV